MVLITTSLARKPKKRLTAACHCPKPQRAKIGAIGSSDKLKIASVIQKPDDYYDTKDDGSRLFQKEPKR